VIRLSRKLPDGSTEREHLVAAARQTRNWAALALPPLPAGCSFIWRAFNEISYGRPSQGGPVPPSEIEAWQRLSGVRLSPWEIDTVHELDRLALRIHAENEPKPT
jgi:hypothetical protein